MRNGKTEQPNDEYPYPAAPHLLHASPPSRVVQDVLALGTWPFPALEGLSELPLVRPDGTIANPRVIFNYDTVTKEPGAFDGIKVDTKGNVWGSGPGGVWVISPAGKALGSIRVPEEPANLAFGEADGKTLYMTARRGLYRVRVLIVGIRPGPK